MNANKRLKYCSIGLVWAMGLLAMVFTGCQFGHSSQSKFDTVPEMASVPNAPPGEGETIDVAQPGDTLAITLSDYSGQPPLGVTEEAKQDGTVKVMLLDKSFVAAGKSRSQLEKEIHDFYVPGYYQQMTVSVQLKEQTRFYFVDGEVKSPGRQVYIGRMSVLRAITSAQGFTDYANKRNVLLSHPDGHIEHINCKKALDHPELDLSVYPGDRIYVKRRLFW